jgi:hypothetical protein
MRQSDGIDGNKPFFRASERFFQADGKWYFAAREGDRGPYRSRKTAEREALAFIQSRVIESQSALQRGPKKARRANRYDIPIYRHVLGLPMEQPKLEELVLLIDD